jgi:predicted acylesterase/phospholipase RssA
MEQGLLPRIIAGSSVGAIIAAIAAVHTDDELRTMYHNINDFNLAFFANNDPLSALAHLLRSGCLQGATHMSYSLPMAPPCTSIRCAALATLRCGIAV